MSYITYERIYRLYRYAKMLLIMMDLQLYKYLYNTKHRTVTDPGISEPGSLANQRHLVCLILRLDLTLLSYMIERSPDLTFSM